MPKKKVAVAMSGGVDSSLAAFLLKDADYDVSGFHIKLWADPNYKNNISVLEQTCNSLDIPLYKFNLEAEFQKLVIDDFCQEYRLGRTPNPCIICNQRVKFGLLLSTYQLAIACLRQPTQPETSPTFSTHWGKESSSTYYSL
jgi:tRNA-specific 2-thiouridylase